MKGQYLNGVKVGEWIVYDENGEIIGIITHDNGKIIKEWYKDK